MDLGQMGTRTNGSQTNEGWANKWGLGANWHLGKMNTWGKWISGEMGIWGKYILGELGTEGNGHWSK